MFTQDLINKSIPQLSPEDSLGKALHLINDFRLTHLPVVQENKFLGLLSEDDLLDVDDDEKTPIANLGEFYISTSVKERVHFLNAVNVALQLDANLIPVTNEENDFMGSITRQDLLKQLGNFAGCNEIGGLIVFQVERSQFSISEISRIVESFDATVLHLNTTMHPVTGILTVTIHINKREISPIVSTFERYDYHIEYYSGEENFENEISENYHHLMKYLDL